MSTGVARMMTMPKPNKGDVHWIVGSTPILKLLPNVFKVQWLTKLVLSTGLLFKYFYSLLFGRSRGEVIRKFVESILLKTNFGWWHLFKLSCTFEAFSGPRLDPNIHPPPPQFGGWIISNYRNWSCVVYLVKSNLTISPCRSPLEFSKTTHLKNRWNEWKQVKISRDGTVYYFMYNV